jgi:hypothetical protein
MAEQDRKPGSEPTPNPADEDATLLGLPKPAAEDAQPDDKDDTARIKLESEQREESAAASPDDTGNIDLRGQQEQKPDAADTPKVTLPVSDDTSRIDLSTAAGKSQTARIDIAAAKKASAKPPASIRPSKTARIQLGSAKHKDTSRIPLEKATPPSDFSERTSGIPADEMSTQDTMRVDVEPSAPAKSKTARIELPKPPAQPAPTGRIKISGAQESDDVFKRHAPPPAAKPPAPAPRKPAAEPPTPIAEEPAPREAAKSKTARIEMPADFVAPAAARPKTIKIKRAGAETTTPADDEAPTATATAEATKSGVRKSKAAKSRSRSVHAVAMESATDAGPLVTGLAVAAVVVIAILVYVLAAQTVFPTLPFIGRIPA